MIKNILVFLLVNSIISLCLSQESNKINGESLLDKLINGKQKVDRNKRSLYYRNDKETMDRERRFRNGIPDYYYDDYYYGDYYYDDYYYDYYPDPFYYGAPLNLGIPRPYGVGLSRYNRPKHDSKKHKYERRDDRKVDRKDDRKRGHY